MAVRSVWDSIKQRSRSARGLTLVEMLVAIVVFALFAIGLLPLATGATLLRQQQQLIAEATDLAQIQLEETRRYWSQVSNLAGANSAVNYTPGQLPLFGETKSDCSLKVTTVQPKETTATLLTDPESVAVTGTGAAGVANYAIRENLATTRTTSCLYKDSDASVNKSNRVRYIAQLFWGPQDVDGDGTADTSPDSSRRVVVRIYQAIGTGATCTGTGCVPACVATPANCLPTGATLRPVLPTFTKDASAINSKAPLVVLTADIAEPKA